jgi:ABC-type tungstate transport system permease subunit
VDARRFADWLTDGEGRRAVENYRVEGRQVYFVWPKDRSADTPLALPR